MTMKNSMKLFGLFKATLALSAILLAASASTANAQYQVTTLSVAVVENFDGLRMVSGSSVSGANNVNFAAGLGSTTQAQRNSAWSFTALNGRGNDNGNFDSGGWRAYSTPNDATDKSLGLLGNTGTTAGNAIATFVNATTSTVTSFVLSYTGEQWRANSGLGSITVEYSVNGASFVALATSTFNLNIVNNLNILNASTSAGFLNGDAAGNRTTGLGATVSSLSLAAGGNIRFRFQYTVGVNSKGVAIDDVSVTFNGGAPPVTSLAWAGGTGTWNATNTNWGTSQTWNASLTGIFEGTAGTVTIDTGGISADAGLVFGTTGYEITGATLTLGGGNATANTITTNSSVTATISSSIAGTGLTKAGAGTLILGANNSLGGDAIISGGNLTLSAAGALGNVGNVTVASGTTLFLSGAAGNRISDAAALSVAGTFNLNGLDETIGALSLTAGTVHTGVGTLTLGGNVTVNSATTSTISGNLNLGGANRVITVANGSSATDLNLGATVISNGGLTFNGSAAGARTDLSGVSIYAGGTTLNSGTLNFEASSTGAPGAVTSGPIGIGSFVINGGLIGANFGTRTINNTVTVSGDFGTGALGSLLVLGGDVGLGGATRTITVNDNPLSITGAISNGALTKAGSGNLTLSGVNTYSGNTTVNSGNLILGASNVIANGSNLTVAGGNFVMGANSDTVNAVTVTSGNITGSGATLTGSSFTVNASTAVNISAALAGSSANLTKSGSGTLVLSGASTYGGNTTISQGTLQLGASNVLPSGTIVRVGTSGATSNRGLFDLNGNSQTIAGLTLLGGNTNAGNSGNVTIGTGGVLTVTGDVSYETGENNRYPSGISGGTLDLGGATRTFTVYDNTNSVVDLDISSIVANGGINKVEAGKLRLSGANTHSGNTTVNAGVLRLADLNAVQNSTLQILGGTVTLNATGTFNIGALAGSVGLALGSNTISVGANGNSTTYSGVLSGTGNVTKTGSGVWTLSGANSFGGNLTVASGAISIAAINNASSNGTLGNSTNAVRLGSSGQTGTLVYTGSNASSNKTFSLVAGGAGAVDVSTASTVLTLSGNVSGSGSLQKDGSGTLHLSSATNSYSGATGVQSGTVRFTAGNASATGGQSLGTNATVNLGVAATSSGTLEYTGTGAATLAKDINALGNGNDAIVNSSASLLTLTGTVTKNGTTLTLRGGSGGLSVNGTIAGSLPASDLVVDGGTVNLNAANTYNGPTSLTGNATLNANAANAMGNTTVVTVGSGSNLVINVSDAVNDTAPVILSGGSITRGAGVSETFGALLLTANSTISFGSGATGTFNFGTYTAADWKLTVLNFAVGNVLTFKTDLTGTITNDSRFSFSNAFSSGWDSGTSTFTITAIPEPTVILPILAFIGLFLWGERKRIPNQIRKRLRKLGWAKS